MEPHSIPSQGQSENQYQDLNQNPKSPNPSQQRQPSSKYPWVWRRSRDNWAMMIRDPIHKLRILVGTFPTEEEAHQAYQAAYTGTEKEKYKIAQGKAQAQPYQTTAQAYQEAIIHCQLCQTAGQQCQSCQNAAQPKQAVMQECNSVSHVNRVRRLTTDRMCICCQITGTKAKGTTTIQNKKRKEKVEKEVTVSRKRIKSFVSKEKQRVDITSNNSTLDIACEAKKLKSSVTSAAQIRIESTSSVHNTSAKPLGFLEDLSSQLLKQLEGMTEAEIMAMTCDLLE